MMFKIEKNIPIPQSHVSTSIFPLTKMEIGDSFFVPNSYFKVVATVQTKARVWYRIRKWKAINDKMKSQFSIKLDRQNKGVRVFRVE